MFFKRCVLWFVSDFRTWVRWLGVAFPFIFFCVCVCVCVFLLVVLSMSVFLVCGTIFVVFVLIFVRFSPRIVCSRRVSIDPLIYVNFDVEIHQLLFVKNPMAKSCKNTLFKLEGQNKLLSVNLLI